MKKLLMLAVAAFAAGSAAAQMNQPIPADPEVRTGKLENGMTYYIRHNEKPKGQADFYILHDVGAIQENDSQQGLAHFLEHMAFNGTKNLPGKQLTEYLETVGVKFGANLNAGTSWDYTCYNMKDVPTSREGIIDSALLILHDWSHFIALEPSEIDSERGVIMEELRTRDGASWRSTMKLLQALGKGTKYERRNLIGYLDGLKNFRHKELEDFYKQWYRPDYQAVIVVGDIDVDAIESKIKNEYLASKERIEKTFEVTNTMAVVVPKGDYEKEGKILARLEEMDRVDTALGLANVEVTDDGKYILVDKLNPREFSEVADVDLDLCRVLYQFYALENEQYSAFMKNLEDYRVSIIDMVDFIYEQKEKGGIDFDDDKSEEIDDLHQQICDAREQLEGDKYDRMVFTLKGAVEGAETFAVVDEIRDMVKEYYDESYVVGDATSNEELSNSFQKDNIMISVLTALFVWAILLFTFQNAGLPFLLVLTIQGSIWINFAIPYVINDKMYFLSYLIVSSIQMGATIDYAIVITSRYMAIRKEIADRKAAIIETLNEAFPTIITSGTMMVCAGFVIGALTSNATIASLGKTLGRGALISIVLVMSVLPQLLLVGDKLIDKAELTRSSKRGQEKEEASES